ncbi:hypothetical protein N836_03175 [Leptolyngbya sp. Heron Island J]|uniref:hypothetical protein n=1 Tax=Leptolyngbya sp. Heron Island J TaxID=1385935 RepID=UPI0003B9A3E6|nr:hypothetical protein [Leptolyngbya sp. Heron Island J]ESA37406.1 hypothetical protein N836_03175 [Leptolyngbya sp. Heron Island J]
MDKLIENLVHLSSSELDEILDKRDSGTFDDAWGIQSEAVPELDQPFNIEDIFVKLSEITGHHEICSYVADDLELLHRADKAGITSDFLTYLKSCYERGQVPNKWEVDGSQ